MSLSFFMEMQGFFIAFKQINFNQFRIQVFSFDVALYVFDDRECSRTILGAFLTVLRNDFRLNWYHLGVKDLHCALGMFNR